MLNHLSYHRDIYIHINIHCERIKEILVAEFTMFIGIKQIKWLILAALNLDNEHYF